VASGAVQGAFTAAARSMRRFLQLGLSQGNNRLAYPRLAAEARQAAADEAKHATGKHSVPHNEQSTGITRLALFSLLPPPQTVFATASPPTSRTEACPWSRRA
jgi:hypothetical protein